MGAVKDGRGRAGTRAPARPGGAEPGRQDGDARTGPLFLLVLIAAAFLPSLFIDFGGQRLAAQIASALARIPSQAASGPDLRRPTGDMDGASLSPAVFQVAAAANEGTATVPPSASPARLFSFASVLPGLEWPPGRVASPRAPPHRA